MKVLFLKFRFLFFFLALFKTLQLKANLLENISRLNNILLIESNMQISELKNSIFSPEGDVKITNRNFEFIVKLKKTFLKKLTGKISLLGNFEDVSLDMNKIKTVEVIYYLKENKFTAISIQDQKVNTQFTFNENKLFGDSREK